MVSPEVTRELQAALNSLKSERDLLDRQIGAMENVLVQMGAPVRRGPGRPKGSGVKRGPGRPPKAAVLVRRGPGRPPKAKTAATSSSSGSTTPVKRGPGRPKGSKNKAQPAKPAAVSKRRGPKWSNAAREAARRRMKNYWAAKKRKK